MRGKKFRPTLLILALIVSTIIWTVPIPVSAPPIMPIGATTQKSPFESNPTNHDISGVSVTTPTFAYDGDFDYRASFKYDVTGYFELNTFTNAPPTTFDVGWVDIKIRYDAAAATNDRYRIVYYVGVAGPVVLKEWSSAAPAIDSQFTLAQTWHNQPEPTDGTWDWTDVGDVRVRFETELVSTKDGKSINAYEVWLSIYPTPLPPAGPAISVQPSALISEAFYDIFFVDVYVTDVSAMLSYEFTLYYNTSVLWAEQYWTYSPFFNPWPSEINNTGGYVSVAYSMAMAEAVGFTGSTPIARIYFSVVGDGTSLLDLRNTILPDVHAAPIPHTEHDGFFANVATHDVAVTGVTASPTCVLPGENITIEVTALNEGTVPETFNVTTTYDSTIIENRTVVDLLPGASEILTYKWNTSGVSVDRYLIKAEASTVPGEIHLSDNTLQWSVLWQGQTIDKVIVGRHDIQVKNVTRAYPTQNVTIPANVVLNVTQGETVYINVTVVNQGNFTETNLNVTAKYFNTLQADQIIQTPQTVPSLAPGENKTLTFNWDMREVKFRYSKDPVTGQWVYQNNTMCDIKANVTLVPYEKGFDYDYTANNKYTDGKVNATRSAPTALFTMVPSAEAYVGQPIKFDATDTNTPTGSTIISYRWNFSDGNVTTTTQKIVHHTYTASGTYRITLNVTNSIGFSDTETKPPLEVMIRDAAITNVTATPTTAVIGQNVNITVTVTNKGETVGDSYNVTLYYDSTRIETILVTAMVPGQTKILNITWNTINATVGTYRIKAVIETEGGLPLEWDINPTDNEFSECTITLKAHDVAVTNTTVSSTQVTQGETVYINVTVVNQGNFTETFTVTVKYNETEVGTQSVTLNAGDSTILNFSWDTTDVNLGNYIITAVASNVTGELDLNDNTFVYGTPVTVNAQAATATPTDIILYAAIGIAIIIAILITAVYLLKIRKPKNTPKPT
jgi:hypothetical protein